MEIFDCIGIGFGPANLALAIAMEESTFDFSNSRFLEAKNDFSWHSGMLLPNTKMQISFLKDLVTLRNPQSKYTFLNYLKDLNRLDAFVNICDFFPFCTEFSKYLEWVAEHFSSVVDYNSAVLRINPIIANRLVEYLEVETYTKKYRCHSIVLAPGGIPKFPEGTSPGNRVIHSCNFLDKIQNFTPENPHQFVVIGAGQSAAEIVVYLLERFPNANIISVIRDFAFRPSDDSRFINELFWPEQTDVFFHANEQFKTSFSKKYANTKYSAVNINLIRKLYGIYYQDKVKGRNRLEFLPFTEIIATSDSENKVEATIRDLKENKVFDMNVDAIFMATGYSYNSNHAILYGVDKYLNKNTKGQYKVQRNYQIESKLLFRPKIFLQGLCEETHGLSDSLLSILPYRSQQIADALVDFYQDRSTHIGMATL